MSDVSEKLAAAGWGPRTASGDEILFFDTSSTGLSAGVVCRGDNRFGIDWVEDGKATSGRGFDLVPLPKAPDPRDAEIERLKACLRKANDGMEEYERKYYLEVNKTEELTAERDRWKDLATRFRKTVIGLYPFSFTQMGLIGMCREFDAMTAPVPESGELVPWTAETRPRWLIMFRCNYIDQHIERSLRRWQDVGASVDAWGIINWEDLLKSWEWSRDGITWNPCGTRQGVSE